MTQRKQAIIAVIAVSVAWAAGFIPGAMAVMVFASSRHETEAMLAFMAVYAITGGLVIRFCMRCPACGALPRLVTSALRASSRRCERCGFDFLQDG